jgi:deoxyribonuclease (pyrimidine dimer)
MTRINVGVKASLLNNRHLIAEHRELKRIPNMVSSGRAKIIDIPPKFTLGKGHVKFFYNKLEYLRKRYEELYQECQNRNFNVSYYGGCWDNIPNNLMNDYTPTEYDKNIIEERILERLNNK